MCKKAIFELIFFYENNRLSNVLLLNYSQMLVYFDTKI
jgi:hypothetical protein